MESNKRGSNKRKHYDDAVEDYEAQKAIEESCQVIDSSTEVIDEFCQAVDSSVEVTEETHYVQEISEVVLEQQHSMSDTVTCVVDDILEVTDESFSLCNDDELDTCFNANEMDASPSTNNTDKGEEGGNLPSGNCEEAFDLQFDTILSGLTQETKVRDADCLADEEETSVIYNPEVAEDFSEAIIDQIETCQEKESDGQEEDPCTKSLYPEARCTLGVTILLICCFMIRFRLPEEALSYMLRLFACLLPHGHRLAGSVYHFRNITRKYTQDLLPNIIYHCNTCYSRVEKKSKICQSCNASLTRSGATAYFLQLKLVSQIASLWKNEEMCDMIRKHRFKHLEQNKEKKLVDIYDGILYQKLFSRGILNEPNNISLSLNTDGAPLFKSSNVSIWPVYLLVNELPIAQRKKRCNSLFYGVWISSSKPQMWSFFKPLYLELKELESVGHEFTDHKGDKFTSKCVLLTCTCDLPARALLYNCNQFNGEYSCWYCLQKGQTYKHASGGISHIYPFNSDCPKGPSRTHESVIKDTDEAMEKMKKNVTRSTTNGHKGKFYFMYLKTFDIINSCVIDYMHGVCLGVVKTLITIWFDKKNKDESFSFFSKRELVNSLLCRIKPTIFVSRIPRSLDELSHWKSSEYRNFLLYWGTPILQHVLKPSFFAHFCLLANSIFILSKEGISQTELATAEAALFLFVENFSTLYGDRYMTLNVHQLVHLTDCVRYTGPLYVNNCFIFEDLNGYIVKQIHGTQGVDTQMSNIIGLLRVPAAMYSLYLSDTDDEEVNVLYHDLIDSVVLRHRQLEEIEDGIRPLGNATFRSLDAHEKQSALSHGIVNDRIKEFYRINMYKKGFYVCGELYKRLDKRQQNIITYCKGNNVAFGSVISFIQSEEEEPRGIINVAIIKTFDKIKSVGCVWEVKRRSTVEFIPIQNILNVNNLLEVNSKCYLCPSPNRYDRD